MYVVHCKEKCALLHLNGHGDENIKMRFITNKHKTVHLLYSLPLTQLMSNQITNTSLIPFDRFVPLPHLQKDVDLHPAE